MIYRFEVAGTAADEQTWSYAGTLVCERQGDFPLLPGRAMVAAFRALTDGRAIFGKPGVGCNGPYTMTRMLIEALP
jgi:hypothetical protein